MNNLKSRKRGANKTPEKGAKRPGYGTLTQSAHRQIRHAILAANLRPGERITVKALQTDLAIGPTPIREALARLASEGFVVGEENRGYRVPGLALGELRDITNQRKLVECQGLRQSILEGDNEYFLMVETLYAKLSKLEEARGRGELDAYDRWEIVHREFHAALISGAQSPWLSRFQELLFDHADRYRRKVVAVTPVVPEIVVDHRRIMEATLDRDADMAALLLARHIERVFESARARGIPYHLEGPKS